MPSKSFTSVRARHALQKYHLCLSIAPNSLWEALNVKARSPNKFMDVSDMQVSDEDGYMTRTANSKIVNVRIWIHSVISKIVFQPLHTDTDMSKNPINGVETTVRDGRGFNMTLDAHFFELVHQKTSLRTDDFYNHSEKITDVCYTETLHEERHIVFYQRDVPDGMRTPWTVLVDASRCRVNEFADLTTSELLLVTLQERTRPCDKIVHMCCMSQAATQTSHPHSMHICTMVLTC